MKSAVYEYSTVTKSDALLSSIGERVDEFNLLQSDRRAKITLRDSDPEQGTFTLLVREGTVPEGNLDLAVTVAPEGERTKVTATLSHNPADGNPTFGSKLYGLFLAGFARLTVLALFYGILLGVSFIFPGRNFWVPAIPPAILFISMIVRAIKVRRRLPKRIARFFCDFCGCTPVSAPPRA